ncbi:hypothetical protein GIB67_023161 [Kingdonia uniflora]|uniref:Aminotransferase-like plant mobile domain-containing protein n=1 Tax=Kingdonia uniflora TaxID=39325 RepID=A0A7J7M5Q9_9MAGN|nr:hypothetical protein GIB67_023161 [Kingdonia uniflora]
MLTSLSIGRYPTQVPYDDAWTVLSNARQLLPNIESNNIKSGNVSISHLRTYLTIAADREDDITISRAFILFMMGHLWFQTANDTVPLGYLAVVADLDEAAQYDWGSAILASLYHGLDTAVTTGGVITGFSQLLESRKRLSSRPIRVSEHGRRGKRGKQMAKQPICLCWADTTLTTRLLRRSPGNLGADSAVSEIDEVLTAKLLFGKRMSFQVPNENCEYYLGDRCWKQLTGEAYISLDPPFSMSPHISPVDLQKIR